MLKINSAQQLQAHAQDTITSPQDILSATIKDQQDVQGDIAGGWVGRLPF